MLREIHGRAQVLANKPVKREPKPIKLTAKEQAWAERVAEIRKAAKYDHIDY